MFTDDWIWIGSLSVSVSVRNKCIIRREPAWTRIKFHQPKIAISWTALIHLSQFKFQNNHVDAWIMQLTGLQCGPLKSKAPIILILCTFDTRYTRPTGTTKMKWNIYCLNSPLFRCPCVMEIVVSPGVDVVCNYIHGNRAPYQCCSAQCLLSAHYMNQTHKHWI